MSSFSSATARESKSTGSSAGGGSGITNIAKSDIYHRVSTAPGIFITSDTIMNLFLVNDHQHYDKYTIEQLKAIISGTLSLTAVNKVPVKFPSKWNKSHLIEFLITIVEELNSTGSINTFYDINSWKKRNSSVGSGNHNANSINSHKNKNNYNSNNHYGSYSGSGGAGPAAFSHSNNSIPNFNLLFNVNPPNFASGYRPSPFHGSIGTLPGNISGNVLGSVAQVSPTEARKNRIVKELVSLDGISETDVLEVLKELGDLDDDIDSQREYEDNLKVIEANDIEYDLAVLQSESEREVIESRKKQRVVSIKDDTDIDITTAAEFDSSYLLLKNPASIAFFDSFEFLNKEFCHKRDKSFGSERNRGISTSISNNNSNNYSSSSSSSSSNNSNDNSSNNKLVIKSCFRDICQFLCTYKQSLSLRAIIVHILMLEKDSLKFHQSNCLSYLHYNILKKIHEYIIDSYELDNCNRQDNACWEVFCLVLFNKPEFVQFLERISKKFEIALYKMPKDGCVTPFAFRKATYRLSKLKENNPSASGYLLSGASSRGANLAAVGSNYTIDEDGIEIIENCGELSKSEQNIFDSDTDSNSDFSVEVDDDDDLDSD